MTQSHSQPSESSAPTPTVTPFDEPTTPIPTVSPDKVTCPICGTTFAPRDSDGKCPICGEHIVTSDQITGGVPLLASAGRWIRQGGNWRLVTVAALVVYQIILFIALWIHLAQTHAL